ncbi:hypothetical protein [Sphingobium xenophagum]|uniref:hypothetical protein n=1 Tax=Sphingobium xenophagum TaxID=121428 RepID=UPI0036D22DAB|tara:strand:+ start:1073 stop:1825 length:753 start_codon:yes stop_codon:yes gene_type:complete
MIATSVENDPRERIIAAALRSLVTRAHTADEDVITLPIFHPSGAAASVIVSGGPQRFRVSDGGQAYREVEMVGGEHLFGRNASKCAEAFGVALVGKLIMGDATAETLAGYIADVAAASAQTSGRIVERVAARSEAALGEKLYRRLTSLFGEARVVADAEVEGASSHKWRISALVHVSGKDLVFEAVSNHHSSVYSSATMFHDLALLENRPKPIAVVESKQAMGAFIGMLSQAASVIESDAPDTMIKRLAA